MHGIHELVDCCDVGVASEAGPFDAEVVGVVDEVLIVSAQVEHDGEDTVGVDTGTGAVED